MKKNKVVKEGIFKRKPSPKSNMDNIRSDFSARDAEDAWMSGIQDAARTGGDKGVAAFRAAQLAKGIKDPNRFDESSIETANNQRSVIDNGVSSERGRTIRQIWHYRMDGLGIARVLTKYLELEKNSIATEEAKAMQKVIRVGKEFTKLATELAALMGPDNFGDNE